MGREVIMDFATLEEQQEWENNHAGYANQIICKDGEYSGLYKWYGYDTNGDNQAKTYGYNKSNYY